MSAMCPELPLIIYFWSALATTCIGSSKEVYFTLIRAIRAYSRSAVGVIGCIKEEVDFNKILSHLNERDT
jgi:hypothetical protein